MNFIPSPYFSDRKGHKVEAVVIHTMVGSFEGTINYFKNNDRQVSAHYCVGLKGEVTQMVGEEKAAHHAGLTSNPKPFPWYKPGVNPNFYTIGIENADDKKPHDIDRINQLPALAGLVCEVCERHNIPIDRQHIVGHRELYDKKTCPGNLDLEKLVEMARLIANPPPATTVITDQTKIPLGETYGTQEVQAIRSMLRDKDRSIVSLSQVIDDLQVQLTGESSKSKELETQQSQYAELLGCANNHPTIVSEIKKLIHKEDKSQEAQLGLSIFALLKKLFEGVKKKNV